MTQKKKPDPTKIANTNPLMIAFKKDRNTPESLEKLRNDAALKSINKGRSNRGQKSLDKLPPAMQKKSDKRLADAKGGKKPRVIPENKPKTNTDTKPTGAAKYDGLTRSPYLAKLKNKRTSEVETEPKGAAKYDGLTRSQYLAKLKKQRQNKNTNKKLSKNTWEEPLW
jgi:hypothetical protein